MTMILFYINFLLSVMVKKHIRSTLISSLYTVGLLIIPTVYNTVKL